MPELPEIEAIRVVLAKELVGKKIKSIAITNGKLVGRHKTAKEFRATSRATPLRVCHALVATSCSLSMTPPPW